MPKRSKLNDKTRLGFAFWMLALYFVFEYGRIHSLIPALQPFRIPFMLTLLMPVLWLAWGDKRVLKDPLIILYGLFVALCGLSIFWSVNQYWAFQTTQFMVAFLIAGTIPAAGLLNDRRKLSAFFTVWVVIHVFVAYTSLTNEGRGTGSFLVDENDMSLALNMAIPYAYFLLQSTERGKLFKLGMVLAIAAMVAAIIYSDSRGGLVGLVVVTAGILFTTKNRIRNAAIISVFALVAYLNVPDGYVDSMATMADAEDNTRVERIWSWRLGWHMYLDHPIAGVGAANWGWRVAEYEAILGDYTGRRSLAGRVSHSLYFTLIPELGTIGVILYGSIVALLVGRLRGIIKREDKRAAEAAGKKRAPPTEAGLLARAMLVSMLGLFSSGAFISVLYYGHLWYLIGFVLALHYVTEGAPKRRRARERAPLAADPLPSGAALPAGRGAAG